MTYNKQSLDKPDENAESMTTGQRDVRSEGTSTGAGLDRDENASTIESTSTGAGLDRDENPFTIESTSTGAGLDREENAFTITPQPIALPPASDMSLPRLGSGSTSMGAGLATDEKGSANSLQSDAQPTVTESVSNAAKGISDASRVQLQAVA
jgi:hypothetical protein